MPRRLRENGLSIVLFGLFGVFLVGQGLTGWRTYNAEQREHHEQTVGLEAYLTTGHFVEATFENWESEFLQMACYVLLTVWLVQKGSSESKPLGGDPERDADPRSVTELERAPGPVRRGGMATRALRELVGDRSRGPLHVLVRAACPRRCQRIQRRPGGTWAASGEHHGIREVVHLLVPVVPELAERVRGRRQHRRTHHLPPTARVARIEACRCSSPRNGWIAAKRASFGSG